RAASPFENLNQTNFLNPDITLSSLRLKALMRGANATTTTSSKIRDMTSTMTNTITNTPVNARTRLEARQRLRDMPEEDRRMLQRSYRMMTLSSATEKAKKPKWHNPILQQMELGTTSKLPR